MVSIVLIILAAVCNAVMDTLSHHYGKSIFLRWKKQKFWSMEVSNANPYYLPHTRYKVDAFHVSKSLMLLFLFLAIVLYAPLLGGIIDFALMGVGWIATFNLFYNKVLIK